MSQLSQHTRAIVIVVVVVNNLITRARRYAHVQLTARQRRALARNAVALRATFEQRRRDVARRRAISSRHARKGKRVCDSSKSRGVHHLHMRHAPRLACSATHLALVSQLERQRCVETSSLRRFPA